jgi:hypothetical protein
MTNPIEIYEELRQLYIKYIHTTLPIGSDKLSAERRKLFEASSAISQEPIIEYVPTYKQVARLADLKNDNIISSDFEEFARLGLFKPIGGKEKLLYKHQKESLETVHKGHNHLVITTGTGSGKTEAFMLPMLANILRESKQWLENKKTPAVRGLILYPLNALAEDQIVRLRQALNSREVVDWMDENRAGERITFGRYTGDTPGSGKKNTEADYDSERLKLKGLWKKAVAKAREPGKENYLDYTTAIDHHQNAELFHRYKMQTDPPDLLITNFSMLNIILMRDQEQTIFDQTRDWLQESKDNVFHLVVDELHSYRGTPGSEVAYTIRLLLRRLELTPDSPQLRILASSASMPDAEKGRNFISGFFGLNTDSVNNKVSIITDQIEIPENFNAPLLQPDHTIIEQEAKLYIDQLRTIMRARPPLTAKKISAKLFGEENLEKLARLLQIVSIEKGDAGNAVIKLRTHLFFRTINNLYACTNPACTQIDKDFQYKGRSIGRLYRHPNSTCSCGGVILELYVCRYCPELFFKGYLANSTGDGPVVTSSPDSLDDQTQVLILPYGIKGKGKGTVPAKWKKATFDPIVGSIEPTKLNDNCIVHHYEAESDLVRKCPACEVSRAHRSPISRHMLGAQIVSQVLGAGLLRVMRRQNSDGKTPKLIVFSDSRQGAAKLSAGIEINHYRDALRQIVLEKIKPAGTVIQEAIDYLLDSSPTEWGERGISYLNSLKELGIKEPFQVFLRAHSGEISKQDVEKEIVKSKKELKDFTSEISGAFIQMGMNPAGPKPSLVVKESGGKELPWYRAYDWSTTPAEGKGLLKNKLSI